MKNLFSCITFCGLVFSTLANSAQGVLTYQISGVGSGTIGSQAFTDADFSLQVSADTGGITHITIFEGIPVSIFATTEEVATLSVSGLPTATLTQGVFAFVSQQGIEGVGLTGLVDGDLLTIEAPGIGLDSYDLTTPIGPIQSFQPLFDQFVDVESDQGLISFSSVTSASFSAVPEPSPAIYFSLAAVGGGLVQRWRKPMI